MDRTTVKPAARLIVERAAGGPGERFKVLASRTRRFSAGDLIADGEPARLGKKAAGAGIASQYKHAAEMCMITGQGQESISLAAAIKEYSEAAGFYEAAGDKKGAANAYHGVARCMETSGDKTGAAEMYIKAMYAFDARGDSESALLMKEKAVACAVAPQQQEATMAHPPQEKRAPAHTESAAPPQEQAQPPQAKAPKKKLTLKQRRALAGEDEGKAKELAARRENAAAAGLFSEAAALYRTINNKLRSAKCEYAAGRGYRAAGDWENAGVAFGRAAELYATHYEGRKKAPTGAECEIVGHAFHHAGKYMVEKGRLEAAAELFVKSAGWYERCDEPDLTGKNVTQTGVFLKWLPCGSSLMMAGKCYRELGWKKQAAEAYTMASEACLRGGDGERSKQALGKARRAEGFAARALAVMNGLAGHVWQSWMEARF